MSKTSGSLCSGYGGLDIAVEQTLGAQPIWYSDIEPAAQRVFEHHWSGVPNLGDIKLIEWDEVEPVDVLTAGYPCQPFSNAGKRKGVEDERHIWPYIAKGIRYLRPGLVVLENVPGHRSRGFDCVLGDLAEMGYRVGWGSVRASDIGGCHKRERVYIVAAHSDCEHDDWAGDQWPQGRPEPSDGSDSVADADGPGLEGAQSTRRRELSARRALSDASSVGRGEGWTGPEGQLGGLGSAQGVDWLEYTAAVRRWERHLGRDAPYPRTWGPRGGVKVHPRFSEWMMGLPEGHITDVPGVNVNAQLKLAGNGVVPQAAAYAISLLLPVVLGGANEGQEVRAS